MCAKLFQCNMYVMLEAPPWLSYVNSKSINLELMLISLYLFQFLSFCIVWSKDI